MAKIAALIITLILTAVHANCQDTNHFAYWISDLDKSMYSRTTYHITLDSIVVKSGPYDFIYFSKDYKKDEVVYRVKLDADQQHTLLQLSELIKRDSVKSQYTNLCIMDGVILHFHFEWTDKKMSTTVSNYYLEKVNPFVAFVNAILPIEYKIGYDKAWLEKLKKECPDDMILE